MSQSTECLGSVVPLAMFLLVFYQLHLNYVSSVSTCKYRHEMNVYQPQVKDRRDSVLVMAKILRLQARQGKGGAGRDQTATRSVSGQLL